MKHYQKAYLRSFPGLNVSTSLYLVNIQLIQNYIPPPKLSRFAPGDDLLFALLFQAVRPSALTFFPMRPFVLKVCPPLT